MSEARPQCASAAPGAGRSWLGQGAPPPRQRVVLPGGGRRSPACWRLPRPAPCRRRCSWTRMRGEPRFRPGPGVQGRRFRVQGPGFAHVVKVQGRRFRVQGPGFHQHPRARFSHGGSQCSSGLIGRTEGEYQLHLPASERRGITFKYVQGSYLTESHGQNLAFTVVYAPCSLDSGL